MKTNVPKILKNRKQEKKWPGRLIILAQVVAMCMLSLFIYHNRGVILEPETSQASVAGATTQPSGVQPLPIPQFVDIKIDNQIARMSTAEFDFGANRYEIIEEVEQTTFDQIVSIILGPPESNSTFKTEVEFNQPRLDYWISKTFSNLENTERIQAEIDIDLETEIITDCQIGSGATNLPKFEITEYFSNYENLSSSESPKFELLRSDLSAEEDKINETCEKINNVKALLTNVEIENFEDAEILDSYAFMREEDLEEIIQFKLDTNNEVVTEILDEEAFKEELEKLKIEVDIATDSYKYRTDEEYLYILGKYDTGRYLNIDKTFEAFKELLETPEELNKTEFFPIELNETDLEELEQELEVQKFSKLLGTGVVNYPIKPVEIPNSIEEMSAILDGTKVEPGETFSFNEKISTQLYDKQFINEIIFENTESQKFNYFENLSIFSTAVYRSALEAGLPIPERMQELKAVNLDYFSYPYEETSVATGVVTLYQPGEEEELVEQNENGLIDESRLPGEDTENLAQIIDLKFTNDSEHTIFIAVENEILDDGSSTLNVELYSTQHQQEKDVELSNFVIDKFTEENATGFVERFTRSINGRTEEFVTKYYN